MPWQSLIVVVEAARADSLSDALMEAGALSVSVEDAAAGTAAEQPIFGEPGSVVGRVWDASLVRALLAEDADADAVLAAAWAGCGGGDPPCPTVEIVPDEDWVQRTQSQFDPIRISGRLWIVPSWHDATDASAINLVLDPGLAFGTGSHPTTQLCLRWLESVVVDGASVIDYGCGSGILALAAAKFGAGSVLGVDIDDEAVRAARWNADRNRVGATFQSSAAPIAGEYDIVVANILANPLKVLAPALARLARPGGRLALAGLLDAQADEVAAVYSPFFDVQPFASQEGWTCLAGIRR